MEESEYKKAYLALKKAVSKTNLVLEMPSVIGFTLEIGTINAFDRIIFVNSTLDYRARLFVLCHEIGHFYCIKGDNLKLAKTVASESIANKRAIGILSKMNLELGKDYKKFYKESVKKVV